MQNKWIHEIEGLEQFVGYKVYEDGVIESHHKRRNHEWIISDNPVRELKPTLRKKGYLKVDLRNNNKRFGAFIHRLVALSFIPNPENKPEVNHKDGNKSNNCVGNLEWCTQIENHRHKCRMGLNVVKKGEDHYLHGKFGVLHHSSKSVIQIDLSDNVITVYPSIRDAAKSFDKHPSGISKCCHGVIQTAFGFKWKYVG